MQRTINLQIDEQQHGKRFDQAVASLIPDVSRSRIQRWIKTGELTLNQTLGIAKQKVFTGDIIEGEITLSDEVNHQAQNIPIDIIYEDDSIIVLNKPAGLVVHPGAGNPDSTLLNALLHHSPSLQAVPRAGIVHRLDKDTSGVMMVAKTIESQFDLVQQLQLHTVKRHYYSLVVGELISGGTVNAPIGRSGNDRIRMSVTVGGKPAVTHYSILKRYQGLTLLECRLETGRTHQIRVHMTHLRHPLVGDPLYGGRHRIPKGIDTDTRAIISNFPRQALHAKTLSFIHPTTKTPKKFTTELPSDMSTLLDSLTASDGLL